ncbi:hypothetical protein F8388_025209 [Cannabis sativa]|uniref:Tryptophan synthase beta chain-like PALP domain-containing protein n=1 Tax=Cannabis sativa TaxID=3483 RepID=A0A7J6FS61_CANSA|nr:hypothetical protein F8388_025209 [Cannabis sativa]
MTLRVEAQTAYPLYCVLCRFLSCQSPEPTSSPSQYSMSHSVSQMGLDFLTKKPYSPPSWASHLNPIPSHSYSLSHLPTPIHKWNLPNLPKNTEVWLKREDLSGMQLSGNKARKLEFLLADAVAQGADCVITLGGIQSNHCRSTAVAARYLNLDSYLILFTSEVNNFVFEFLGICGPRSRIDRKSPGGAAKGLGYAISTSEELKLVKDIAEATGVVLDPVYSGKAAYGLLKDMSENPKKWDGRKILFVHTGGLLGWYGKIEQMGPLVGNWRRMDLP